LQSSHSDLFGMNCCIEV